MAPSHDTALSSASEAGITQGELLFGLSKRPDATARHTAVREFLRRVDVLPWDVATAEIYGPARAASHREGRVLASMGLLIGAHALSVDAVLVTNDRAFAQLPGLRTGPRNFDREKGITWVSTRQHKLHDKYPYHDA